MITKVYVTPDVPSDDYIEPSEATHIRVFEVVNDQWEIDAADDTGNCSDVEWSYYDGILLTKEAAISHAAEFATEYGRPDLANTVYVDEGGQWVLIQHA